ncbi:helix-turn-helix transcriptional regulator [Pseudomonas sp. PS02288]|uniref:helix-turn-helix domain-containing protein n=1 Tax=Pseudomonas sp. PS02288 TaxID=2991443 RepID=UPI00249C81A4|nr:helix-turn-helix transcriptional regulator [Pseudomonas sp. PS02288]
MSVQVISRDGEAEYAVVPWAEYQALLAAAGRPSEQIAVSESGDGLAQLSSRREALGLSREQLARQVGISPSYLELIERGEREPDAAIRRSLAFVLSKAAQEQEAPAP